MITIAPLRISFAGGGTDIQPYCLEYGGAVLSASITKYAIAHYPSDSSNPLEDTICGHFNCASLSVRTEVKPMSGLGGSAACFVAGIKAVQPSLTKRQIAQLAFHLERDVMGVAGGIQDQYMAAFGGLNYLEITSRVKLVQLPIPHGLAELLLLVYLGKRNHQGQDIIKDQNTRMNLEALHEQKTIAGEMVSHLANSDFTGFGRLLDAAWHSKMRFSPLVAPEWIKDFYYACLKWGAIGGKLTGAGGGGYMVLMARPETIDTLKLNLWKNRVHFENVEFEGKGVRCLAASADLSKKPCGIIA